LASPQSAQFLTLTTNSPSGQGATAEPSDISASLPTTISSYLSHLDTDTNLLDHILDDDSPNNHQINTNTSITTNDNHNSNNNNNIKNPNERENELFQFDDVNLATPTTEAVPLMSLIPEIPRQQQQQQNDHQQDTIVLPKEASSPPLPLPPPLSSSLTSPKPNNYNPSQNQSYHQLYGMTQTNNHLSLLPTTSSNANNNNPGLLSRSNSQPDLSLYYSYYSNENYQLNNADNVQLINSNYIEQPLTQPNFINSPLSSTSTSTSTYSNKVKKARRRHPSLSYNKSSSMSTATDELEENFFNNFLSSTNFNFKSLPNPNPNIEVTNNNNFSLFKSAELENDGLFLGVDAITDFLSESQTNQQGGQCTAAELFEGLPDLEDLMSLVTFETASQQQQQQQQASQFHFQPIRETQCDLNLHDFLPNFCDEEYADHGMDSLIMMDFNNNNVSTTLNYNGSIFANSAAASVGATGGATGTGFCTSSEANCLVDQRTTRSAPPSPTPQRKKQRHIGNLPWNKTWTKMEEDEKSQILECLTGIINDEMGLREQLEIIRILNPNPKLKPTDTQFIIDFKMIDDEKYKRIKEIIKIHGPLLNEKHISDNSSDCSSANSCPLAKRELRIKRAQQRLKLKQQKDKRQIVKESKCGLFSNTEVIKILKTKVLPEDDIDIDILS
jgi:hypothetical protein